MLSRIDPRATIVVELSDEAVLGNDRWDGPAPIPWEGAHVPASAGQRLGIARRAPLERRPHAWQRNAAASQTVTLVA